MKWWLTALAVAFIGAAVSHYALHVPLLTFGLAAASLIVLSKLLGEATEELSAHLGQNIAGLVNVTLSNLAELIIIFAAVRAGKIELVVGLDRLHHPADSRQRLRARGRGICCAQEAD